MAMGGGRVGSAWYDLELRDEGFLGSLSKSQDQMRAAGATAESSFGTGASAAIDQVGDAADRTGGRFEGLGSKASSLGGKAKTAAGDLGSMFGIPTSPIEAAGVAVTVLAGSISLASDKAEAASKVQVLFGDSAVQITEASKGAAQAVGLSSGAYLDAAGGLGNLLINFGLAQPAAADMSQSMITLAADMGSFNNASPEEVLAAMKSALVGETEPLRQFGVMLSAAAVETKALEMGLISQGEALSESAKAEATYALIVEQTSNASGDRARTMDSLANQQITAAAEMDEAMTKLGEAIMPIVATIMPLVVEVFVAVIEVAGQLAATVMSVLGPALDIVGQAFAGLSGAATGAVDMIDSAWNGLVGVIGDAISMLLAPMRAVIDLAAQIPSPFQEDAIRIRNAIDMVQGDLESWGEKTEQTAVVVKGGTQAALAAHRSAEQGITTSLDNVAGAAESSASRVEAAFGEGMGGGGSWAGGVITATRQAADQRVAIWSGSVDDTIRQERRLAAESQSTMRTSIPQIMGTVRELTDAMKQTFLGVGSVFVRNGVEAMRGYASGLRSETEEPIDAIANLRERIKTALSPAKEIMRHEGFLGSKWLANALNDGRPEVVAEAQATMLQSIDRLAKLKPGSADIGRSAMQLLANSAGAQQGQIIRTLSGITGLSEDTLRELIPAAGKGGRESVSAFEQAIRNGKGGVGDAGGDVAQAGKTGLGSVDPYSSGQHFVQRFMRGVDVEKYDARNQLAAAARFITSPIMLSEPNSTSPREIWDLPIYGAHYLQRWAGEMPAEARRIGPGIMADVARAFAPPDAMAGAAGWAGRGKVLAGAGRGLEAGGVIRVRHELDLRNAPAGVTNEGVASILRPALDVELYMRNLGQSRLLPPSMDF